MKCNKINFLDYIEGKATPSVLDHVRGCKNCQKESEKFEKFSRVISPFYFEGKRLEKDLEMRLQTLNLSRMEKLPTDLIAPIDALKKKSLISQVKKVIGEGKKNVEELVENFLSPQLEAMPASPKDITRTKKSRKKKQVKNKSK